MELFDQAAEADIILLNYMGMTIGFVASAWLETSFTLQLLRCSGEYRWMRATLWCLPVAISIMEVAAAIVPWVMWHPAERAWKPWIEGQCYPKRSFWTFALVISREYLNQSTKFSTR